MIVSIYSRKGGQGKTPLSFGIFKHYQDKYKSFYLTNDDDGGEIILENLGDEDSGMIGKKIPAGKQFLVYDAGGYTDDSTLNLLKNSDIIIVPAESETRKMKSAYALIQTIKNMNMKAKVILAITKFVNKQQDKEFIKILFENSHLVDKTVYLRETSIFDRMIIKNLSMIEIMNKSPLNKKGWEDGIYKDFMKLIDEIDKEIK